ncbi:MAG: hypothetical protein CM15mP86_08020 [Gammaproteobacteria bacterium]|nr:MAG: hypothetical protein CM15mP86_08020 [Gammaproteobacteria bacterium]
MPTELEIWNTFWLATLANAAYFVGLAFLLWVSFRAANMAGDSDNLLGKIVVTVFCLIIVFQLNFNAGAAEWVGNGIAGVFAAMQAQGVEISQGAQNFIANAPEPGAAFNLNS